MPKKIKTHSDLLAEAVEIARRKDMTFKEVCKKMDTTHVNFYHMRNKNFVPVWYWEAIEEITDSRIRQEDFIRAVYNKPKRTRYKKSA